MSELSPQEIEDAAREAGISPAELRYALAQQAGVSALVPRDAGGERGLLPASPRGRSAANAESTLPYPPEQAVRSVKHQLERQLGCTGHMQGGTEADIYDEKAGLVYRIQAADDGAGGSLVRVDLDPTPLRGRRTLAGMALGATVGLFVIAGMVIPGLIGWGLLAGAAGLTLLGGGSLAAMGGRTLRDAKAHAAQALVEAEHTAPIGGAATPALEGPEWRALRALPPARDDGGHGGRGGG